MRAGLGRSSPRIGLFGLILCSLPLSGAIATGCTAPTVRRWEMTFSTPDSSDVIVLVETERLFAGNSSPSVQNTQPRQLRTSELTPIGTAQRDVQRRRVDGVELVAGPPSSGAFSITNASTGQELGVARTGHSYSSLWGISPCGEYVAYFVPGMFWRRSYVHHIPSGRRSLIDIDARWRLEEWVESGARAH